MNERILSKINVVDMTEGVAGPYAAMLLAEMGANVIKVERPAGDWSRPTDHFRVKGEANAQFIALNRNKRDISLDVATVQANMKDANKLLWQVCVCARVRVYVRACVTSPFSAPSKPSPLPTRLPSARF